MGKELLTQYRKRVLIFSVLLIFWSGVASADLTKQDVEEIRKIVREEIQHVNTRIDNLDDKIDDLDDKLNKRIDSLENLCYVLLAGMFALVGFVLWDRRSALAPAIRKSKELEDREDRLERVLKEYAFKNPEMREILKRTGIL